MGRGRKIDLHLLKRLHDQGQADRQIAAVMEIAPDTVRKNRLKLGLPNLAAKPAVWTPERLTVLRDLAAQGKTARQMAEIFDKPVDAIRNACRTYEIEYIRQGPNPFTARDDERLISMHLDGVARKEMARALNRSLDAVDARLGKLRAGGHLAPRAVVPKVKARPAPPESARVSPHTRRGSARVERLRALEERYGAEVVAGIARIQPGKAGSYRAMQELAERYDLPISKVQQLQHQVTT